jgi:hypothetical protein
MISERPNSAPPLERYPLLAGRGAQRRAADALWKIVEVCS